MSVKETVAATVAAAVDRIVEAKGRLDEIDDSLSQALAEVEEALGRLKPGVPAYTSYDTVDGRFFVGYEKVNAQQWALTYAREDEEGARLRDMPRHIRAEVWSPQEDGLPPIGRLVGELGDELQRAVEERADALKIVDALRKAGVLQGQ